MIGFLHLWGVRIELMSIVCILLSLGISIDLTAHVVHRYEHCRLPRLDDRLRHTLASVGWPILQAALSTLLSVLVLAAVPSYIVRVLWRSVFLSVLSGLYHGLIILPVIYAALPEKRRQRPGRE